MGLGLGTGMTWDEWDRLKADAAERHTRMRLDMIDGGGSAGSDRGDLKVSQKDLAVVGDAAFALRQGLARDGNHARATSDAAAKKLAGEGYSLGSALSHVTKRWEEQTQSLLDACAHISNHLDFTRKVHAADDDHVFLTVSAISQLDQGFDEGVRR
ncbi:hypothetical protein [Streptomyces sp. NPDC050504]|uniref:hypothetical protein n=1 Tax=Streptomyces sp. NPDC050504 TaxID=3365618 RepID=UPI0037B3EAF2